MLLPLLLLRRLLLLRTPTMGLTDLPLQPVHVCSPSREEYMRLTT